MSNHQHFFFRVYGFPCHSLRHFGESLLGSNRLTDLNNYPFGGAHHRFDV
jgi:hypothetical protein